MPLAPPTTTFTPKSTGGQKSPSRPSGSSMFTPVRQAPSGGVRTPVGGVGQGGVTVNSVGGSIASQGTPVSQSLPPHQVAAPGKPFDPATNTTFATALGGTPLSQSLPPYEVAAPGRPYDPATYSPSQVNSYLQWQLALQNHGYDAANRQIGWDMTAANTGLEFDTRGLNEQYGFDVRRLNNDEYRNVGLGRETNDTNRYIGGQRYQTAMDGATGTRDIRSSELIKALNLGQTRFTGEQGFIGDERGMTERERDLAMRANQLSYEADSRRAKSDAIARGAMTSSGFSDTRSELSRALGISNDRATLGFDRGMNALDQRAFDNDLRFRGLTDDFEIGTQRNALQFDQATRTAGTNWEEVQRTHETRSKFLDSLSTDYGISRDEMDSTLRRGIERLGLDYSQLYGRLADAFNDNNTARNAAGNALLQQILLAAQSGSIGSSSVNSTPIRPNPSTAGASRVTTGENGNTVVERGGVLPGWLTSSGSRDAVPFPGQEWLHP